MAMSPLLPERRDDVLGEQLDLPARFVDRHQALVEEPGEPLELAVALVDGGDLLDLALDLVDGAGEAVLHVHEAIEGPLRRWERRVRIERVLLGVLGETEGLPETEPGEVGVEAEEVRLLQ